MPQLKIVITFNTLTSKQKLNNNEIIDAKKDIEIDESISDNKNGKFSNLSKKRK